MRISDWSSDVCSSDLGIGNHLRAARGIIAAPLFRAVPLGNDIGAIERVIKAAPARVRRVQRIAGVGERHDELRPGESRDFRVHTGGADGKGDRIRLEIADLAKTGKGTRLNYSH